MSEYNKAVNPNAKVLDHVSKDYHDGHNYIPSSIQGNQINQDQNQVNQDNPDKIKVQTFKQTEIGLIPEDWVIDKLENIATLLSSKRIFESEYVKDGIPFYRGKEITMLLEKKKIENPYYISNSRYEKIKKEFGVPIKGDILITAVGTLGNPYLIPNNEKFYFKDGNLIWLKNIKDVNKTYLSIQLDNFKKDIISNAIGSSQKALTIAVLKNQKIPLPPLPEQKAIAQVLSDTDSLIQAITQKLAKKRAIKQGAMQQLLTPKEDWEVKTLGEIATVRDGTHQTPTYVGTGIPFYSVESVTNNNFKNTKYITEEAHKLLTKTFRIEKGDILMTRIGSIGDCKLVDWDVNASFYVSLALLKIKPEFSASYICHYSKSANFKREADINSLQSAIPRKINLGPISNIKIELPNYEEQTRIATILSHMDTEIEQIEQKLSKYKLLKQGLMQQLLTGKIRLV